MTIRVGINGFGRIGRQVHRAIREHYPDRIDVVAVNDAGNRKIMTHILMCCGSVHCRKRWIASTCGFAIAAFARSTAHARYAHGARP